MYLVNELIKLSRSLGPDGLSLMEGLISNIPQNTLDKFVFLSEESRTLVKRDQLMEAADSYAYFLFLYGLSETNYRSTGSNSYRTRLRI